MLYTKSIHKPKSDSDGLRISVMSRHTLEDGITPDPKISNASFDSWLQILAPRDKLVGNYYKRNLPFDEYERKYVEYLEKQEVRIEVQNLAIKALNQDITLLCIEESPNNCHRRILAEICQIYQPKLKVEHR
jgi:uncharacterized protein YeaO (DUF488 family)